MSVRANSRRISVPGAVKDGRPARLGKDSRSLKVLGVPPRSRLALALLALVGAVGPGCASIRWHAPLADLRPCGEEFAYTRDGWKLGIRHIRPEYPDPGKLPVVLCHGLGLNGTFWTITDDHLARQLADRGYHVFIPDMRGSGASRPVGLKGKVNSALRQTPLLEIGDGDWTVDDEIRYDVPAILDHVRDETGSARVNWVGHSLGGMLMFGFLETSPEAWRIANFVGMGSTITLADVPQTKMLKANRALRGLMRLVSTGRIAQPMMFYRLPGLAKIDRFYYTAANVDRRTISRFYGYTLENPGRGALHQLDPYLERGHFVSADGTVDYAQRLGEITTPTLLIAGDGDIMSDVASTEMTFDGLSSPDKALMRFGRLEGQVDDYGHCDLVWSRHAPREIFPVLIDWLDPRQPGVTPSPQAPAPPPLPSRPSAQIALP
jgi:pimeloyl-ACP methyl ester carboxylesterase